jgi:hypothetical protein
MVEIHLSEKRVYAFTHIWIQDVAYQSLLKPAQQQLHLRLVRARQVGEQLYELAEQLDGPTYRQEAHYSLGHTLYLLGDITSAYRHLQRGIAMVAPGQPHSVIMGLMNRQQFPLYPKDPIRPVSEGSLGAISCPMCRV